MLQDPPVLACFLFGLFLVIVIVSGRQVAPRVLEVCAKGFHLMSSMRLFTFVRQCKVINLSFT